MIVPAVKFEVIVADFPSHATAVIAPLPTLTAAALCKFIISPFWKNHTTAGTATVSNETVNAVPAEVGNVTEVTINPELVRRT